MLCIVKIYSIARIVAFLESNKSIFCIFFYLTYYLCTRQEDKTNFIVIHVFVL